MSAPTYKNIIYFFGPDTTNLTPDTRINIKIGLSGNNDGNFNQRLGEHQRHCPGDIAHAAFPTNGGDAAVRKTLCAKFPQKFGTNRGKGREVISLLVKDVKFLLEQAALFFNDANYGNAKVHDFASRQEQDNCLAKTISFFTNPDNSGREFLWDAKMRFGKTHTAYELVMTLDARLVLILTGRPTDTKKAWIDAMDHVDFDFGPDNFIDASKQSSAIVVDANKRTIIFASLQDLAYLNNDEFKEKFKNFPNLTFDLLIKDEVHLGFDTPNSKEALSKLQSKHILNLSGTPFRALMEDRFPYDAKFTWSYVDEQKARAQEIATLGQSLAEKEGQYYWLCPMKVFAITLSPELYEEANLFTEEEGFTFHKLFATEDHNGRMVFRHEHGVGTFLNALSRGMVMPYSNQACNSHQYISDNLKHTLWYVPGVPEAKLLAEKLRNHRTFHNYEIIIAAGDNGNEGNDTTKLVKDRIADVESGRDSEHIGTITLSCGKLSHGVSIPEWGSIFCLDDTRSAQLYFQLIFRGQTPLNGIKHECYVFDFNPNRTLQMMYNVAEATANTGDPKPILTEMLNAFNVLCYEGTEFKHISADDLITKLQSSFGRTSSITGLQNLFAELPFDLDADLSEGLDDIEDGSSKVSEIEVNQNALPNGKNSVRSNDGSDNSSSGSETLPKEVDEKTLRAQEEQNRSKIKAALKTIPLYLSLTNDQSFDEVITNLDSHATMVKTMIGITAKAIKKILSSQSNSKQHQLNHGIVGFRNMEMQDQKAFTEEVKQGELK